MYFLFNITSCTGFNIFLFWHGLVDGDGEVIKIGSNQFKWKKIADQQHVFHPCK